MVYSQVILNNLHLVLPKKAKYTKRDVYNLMLSSLFNRKLNNGKTFSENEAKFIVKCTAIFHKADWSQYLSKESGLI